MSKKDNSENNIKGSETNLNKKINRRGFLKKSEKLVGVLAGIGFLGPYAAIGSGRHEYVHQEMMTDPKYPFKLGVASGEPLPDGVVLWTRLAPDPLTAGGGMSDNQVQVSWEVSEDDSFSRIIKSGMETAVPEYAHSVHAEVEGLLPNKHYFYRFKTGNHVSAVGRTKTAPANNAELNELNFAFASCQSYPAGHYTAYEHMVKEDLDVVLFLGDYIYEGKMPGRERAHIPDKQVTSIDDYRIRYGQYKSDPLLQAAHAAFPWIVTLDDHEIKNNWGGNGEQFETESFLSRREAALQVYYEHMPLRKSSKPENINMSLCRKFQYGKLAEFNVLDTRQYRSAPACVGKGAGDCDEHLNPSRTLLGEEQERWLFDSLRNSSAHWNILAQQVIMAQVDTGSGEEVKLGLDKWDGFVESRKRLFDLIKENDLKNVVVLAGDSHKNWVNDLKEDFDDQNSAVIATEFGTTSITSGGNGSDQNNFSRTVTAENPHVKFMNTQRGYVSCKVTPEKWQTYFRIVPFIDKQGAPVQTRATFVVNNGKPGAERS